MVSARRGPNFFKIHCWCMVSPVILLKFLLLRQKVFLLKNGPFMNRLLFRNPLSRMKTGCILIIFCLPCFFIYETGYLWNGTPDVSYTAGTPGQNNLKPAALFNLHYVVTIGNILYDPSYGKVYQSLQDVDNAFSGFLKFTPLSCMIQQNPPGIQISVRMIQ